MVSAGEVEELFYQEPRPLRATVEADHARRNERRQSENTHELVEFHLAGIRDSFR